MGADVNEKDRDDNTPLILASREGHLSMVELLLSKGADVHDWDKKGNTPIRIASKESHLSIVKLLLLSGANPEELPSWLMVRYKWPLTMLLYCLQARGLYIPIDAVDMLGDMVRYENIDDYHFCSDDDFDYT